MKCSVLTLWAATFACCALQAQTTNPLIAEAKTTYAGVKNNLLKAAEKMPEDAYSFKATADLQTFGQRISHVAGQIATCSRVKGGEAKPGPAATVTSKADLVAALKASFDECDAAWETVTDANALEMVSAGRGQRSRLGILIGNTNHDSELYGYISVYMRLKSIVPPSSDRAGR